MTPIFASALDPIVTFVIIVVASGVISVLKKKGMIKGLEEQPRDEPPKPASTPQPRRPMATPTQAPRPAATSWEAELRRLLEGEAPPPVRPRPVVVAQPPVTPPIVRPTAVKPVIVRPVPAMIHRPVPARMPSPASSPVEISAKELAPMTESRQAYERASQLDKAVAEHIERVPGQRVLATSVIRRPVSPEVTQVVALFKNARTARQAVIASVIFSPPRAMASFD
jgi:hypothetical protein